MTDWLTQAHDATAHMTHDQADDFWMRLAVHLAETDPQQATDWIKTHSDA